MIEAVNFLLDNTKLSKDPSKLHLIDKFNNT